MDKGRAHPAPRPGARSEKVSCPTVVPLSRPWPDAGSVSCWNECGVGGDQEVRGSGQPGTVVPKGRGKGGNRTGQGDRTWRPGPRARQTGEAEDRRGRPSGSVPTGLAARRRREQTGLHAGRGHSPAPWPRARASCCWWPGPRDPEGQERRPGRAGQGQSLRPGREGAGRRGRGGPGTADDSRGAPGRGGPPPGAFFRPASGRPARVRLSVFLLAPPPEPRPHSPPGPLPSPPPAARRAAAMLMRGAGRGSGPAADAGAEGRGRAPAGTSVLGSQPGARVRPTRAGV